jgi:hypothetical protein
VADGQAAARELPALFAGGLQAAARRLVDAASPAGNLCADRPQDPLLLSRIEMERLAAPTAGSGRGCDDRPAIAFIFATAAAAFAARRCVAVAGSTPPSRGSTHGRTLRLESRARGATPSPPRTSIGPTPPGSVVSGGHAVDALARLRAVGRDPRDPAAAGGGFLAGTAACLAASAGPRMTFAFGSSLMGVCVDYPLPLSHYRESCPTSIAAPGLVRPLPRLPDHSVGIAAMGRLDPGLREIACSAAPVCRRPS